MTNFQPRARWSFSIQPRVREALNPNDLEDVNLSKKDFLNKGEAKYV
jgi:hypothetical protein